MAAQVENDIPSTEEEEKAKKEVDPESNDEEMNAEEAQGIDEDAVSQKAEGDASTEEVGVEQTLADVEAVAEGEAADASRLKDEEEARLAEEARLKEEEETRLAEKKAAEEARLKAEEEARLAAEKAAKEARLKAEEEARLAEEKAAEEARLKAEEEARLAEEKAAEEARLKAEEEARLAEEKAAEEDRLKAEEEARLAEEKAAEEARLKAEEEARLAEEKEAEKVRLKAEEEARLAEEKAAEEARLKAEQEAKLAEEKAAEEARVKAEEIARIAEKKAAEEEKLAEEKRLAEKKAAEAKALAAVKIMTANKLTPEEEAEKKAAKEARAKEELRMAELAEKEAQDADRKLAQGKPPRLSFAGAFGGTEDEDSSPDTPPQAKKVATPATAPLTERSESMESEPSSSAVQARKNKRVSGLVNSYLDKVAKDPLPGDSVELRASKRLDFTPSPAATRASFGSVDARCVQMPKMDGNAGEKRPSSAKMKSIRDRFEKSSSHGSTPKFEFGDAFYQKKKFETDSAKKKQIEAKSAMRGFDQMMLEKGKPKMGEVDTSNLGKTYVFEGPSDEKVQLNDGTTLDYKNENYQAYVFLVHRTRGLLLLKCTYDLTKKGPDAKAPRYQVPGGQIQESEFLDAIKASGNPKVQLQMAARHGAARKLYENTSIDVRDELDRLKPAVLNMNPEHAKDGVKLLKNEHESRLFYFLQVSEVDFVQAESNDSVKLTPLEEDPDLKLKLSPEYDGFTFAKEPADAADILQEHGESPAAGALNMVMSSAAEAPPTPAPQTPEDVVASLADAKKIKNEPTSPDAIASVHQKKTDDTDDLDAPSDEEYDPNSPNGKSKKTKKSQSGGLDPNDPKSKGSTEQVGSEGVLCCCGFW